MLKKVSPCSCHVDSLLWASSLISLAWAGASSMSTLMWFSETVVTPQGTELRGSFISSEEEIRLPGRRPEFCSQACVVFED